MKNFQGHNIPGGGRKWTINFHGLYEVFNFGMVHKGELQAKHNKVGSDC